MLIPSPRHTERDLETWRINEAMDRENAKRIDWTKLERDAMAEMQRWIEAGDGSGYLGVSWGKDSVVVAHLLCKMQVRYPMVWVRMPGDNPDCELVRDAFLATHNGAWYTEIQVDVGGDVRDGHKAGFAEAARRHGERHISGVRAAESSIRKLRTLRWGRSTEKTCAPIAWWSTDYVFAYIYRENLPLHPAYACTQGRTYERQYLRVAAIGGVRGTGVGRRQWEEAYYPDAMRAIKR